MQKLVIVGLGPGSSEHTSKGAWQALLESDILILRTQQHPIVKELKDKGLTFTTCDHFYEQSSSFEEVYCSIVDHILSVLQANEVVYYAVPGHPFVLEQTVTMLQEKIKETTIDFEILPSMSGLEIIYARLGISPIDGIITIDAMDMPAIAQLRGQPLLITQVYNRYLASDVKLQLLEFLPPEHEVTILKAAGVKGQEQIITLPLYELDRQEFDHLSTVYVPRQEEYVLPIDRLLEIMSILRGPEGCPWDKEQTHASLMKYLLEETYEVLEALQEGDMYKLEEELGDLLLQIVFHAQIAKENHNFNFDDVVKAIVAKLERRHPHVFGDIKVSSSDEVLKNWEQIKAREKQQSGQKISALGSVPQVLPALMQADKLQERASSLGFDWEGIDQVWEKFNEELAELQQAYQDGSDEQIYEEVGDLFFSLVNVARFLSVDSEQALLQTVQKFKKRFSYIEKQIEKSGKEFSDFTINQLDKWWEEAKEFVF